MKWHVPTKFLPRISPKKENYIQLPDLTWPKQNSCNKNPQPPITFLMVRPLLILKPQTNIRKKSTETLYNYLYRQCFSNINIWRIMFFEKDISPYIFTWYKNIFETKSKIKTKIQMICFLPHCFFCIPERVSFNHVTNLKSFLRESRLFFPAQTE